MRYTNKQIRENILEWVTETDQHDFIYAVAYCLGFYGYVTRQIFNVLSELHREGILK